MNKIYFFALIVNCIEEYGYLNGLCYSTSTQLQIRELRGALLTRSINYLEKKIVPTDKLRVPLHLEKKVPYSKNVAFALVSCTSHPPLAPPPLRSYEKRGKEMGGGGASGSRSGVGDAVAA